MEIQPGRPSVNAGTVLTRIRQARKDRINLLVFPELAVPGYLLGDEWEYESFLRECESCADEIRRASGNMTVIFGSVGVDWNRRNEDGRIRKYNALFVAHNRKFIGPEGSGCNFVIKTLSPNYREFDETRHFFDLRKLALEQDKPVRKLIKPVKAGRLRLGCVLCEDGWDADYAVSPLQLLAAEKSDLFINCSSSPYTFNKNHKRNRVFLNKLPALKRPLLYVNNVGIQNNGKTVFSFDGCSTIYDAKGNSIECPVPFEDTTLTADIAPAASAQFEKKAEPEQDTIADIHRAIIYGSQKFLKLCRIERVVIGVSGGIDSAVVAALYSRILPPDRILAVNMPGQFNSMTTRNLARDLVRNLGCLYAEIPITESIELTRAQMGSIDVSSIDGSIKTHLELSGFMMENVQARDRSARILSALAAAFGAGFTCNANKSEMTVGYGTFYGDIAGFLANISDLWKMEVYELARHINSISGRQIIPQGILDVTPSAELSPAQNVDEKKGDPIIYPYHDLIFKLWVERWNRVSPEEILTWYAKGTLAAETGYAGDINDLFPTAAAFIADLERWWNLYQGVAVAKRIQAPPVLAVKRRAFGFDHREAQMGARYTSKYNRLKERLLKKAAGHRS